MAAAASKSRPVTRRVPATARYPNTNSSSAAKMGWTWDRSPNRSAVIWKMNPPIMAAMPSSQAGQAGQPDQEPGVKARRLVILGAFALAQRGRGRARAGRDGQQDCLVHQRVPSLGPAGLHCVVSYVTIPGPRRHRPGWRFRCSPCGARPRPVRPEGVPWRGTRGPPLQDDAVRPGRGYGGTVLAVRSIRRVLGSAEPAAHRGGPSPWSCSRP